jgi:aspartate racemase
MTDRIPPSQMRTLGIIGGTAWHSTIEYYRHINTAVNALYGNQTNPPLIIYNLNQAHIHALQRAGAWSRIAEIFHEAAVRLKAALCQGLLFASNTSHKVVDDVAGRIDLPILHMADAIGGAARPAYGTVGLMGTLFTMEQDFLSRPLLERYGIQTLTPAVATSRMHLHEIIQRELSLGELNPDSKGFILDEMTLLQARGAEAIVLGCTELPLIVNQEDMDLPLLDTTRLHAQLAVDFILGDAQS